jgi:hypothetical protein
VAEGRERCSRIISIMEIVEYVSTDTCTDLARALHRAIEAHRHFHFHVIGPCAI